MRLVLACLLGKIIYQLSLLLHLGGGSTWPGHVALKIDPELINQLESKLSFGSVAVSGTNGKTTTANMLARIFRAAGYEVIHNHTSANLLNGLASSLILSTSLKGLYPRFGEKSLGVFEVDEGALPGALGAFSPEVLVLLNLSRDQLDRYAEIDLTVTRWQRAISSLSPLPKITYFEKDNRLKEMVSIFPKKTLFPFSIPTSLSPLKKPSWLIKDEAAASAAAGCFKLADQLVKKTLESFTPVFGRGEVLDIGGVEVTIYLAKNPQSFNENLKQSVFAGSTGRLSAVLLILNDNIPDGRDVSWIYDIDPNLLKKVLCRRVVFVSGKRASDMALRLKYAGLPRDKVLVEPNLKRAIKLAVQGAVREGELVILPTYSAMLEVRKILTGKSLG